MKVLLNAKHLIRPVYVWSSLYVSNYKVAHSRYNELFGDNLFINARNDLSEFLNNLFNTPDIKKYYINEWRYCPVCIKLGYHSMLHQISLVKKCPFHNVPLYTECPQCHKNRSYIIDFSDLQNGFKCLCGYSYLENDNVSEVLSGWYLKGMNDVLKNKINVIEKRAKYLFPSFTWYLNKQFNNDLYKKSYIIIEELLDNKSIHAYYKYKIRFDYDLIGSLPPLYNDPIYDCSRFFMMDQYITIVKSIARNIRKKKKLGLLSFFKTNKLYLYYDYFKDKLSKDGLCYKDINPELYAYIMWRKEVEGHDYINTIHTKLINRGSGDPQFTIKRNITGTLFYRYVINEFEEYIDAYRDNENITISNLGIIINSFERIIGVLLSDYYKIWLTCAELLCKPDNYEVINFNKKVEYPRVDFIIKIKNSNQAILYYFKI